MYLIIQLTFAVFLFLNNLPEINSFPNRLLFGGARSYDDLIPVKRQAETEDVTGYIIKYAELMNRLNQDDRQTVYWITEAYFMLQSRSCLNDEEAKEISSNDNFDAIAKIYSSMEIQYHQLLKKLDENDRILLKKIIHQQSTYGFQLCQLMFDKE